jgi:hypothetical protein
MVTTAFEELDEYAVLVESRVVVGGSGVTTGVEDESEGVDSGSELAHERT